METADAEQKSERSAWWRWIVWTAVIAGTVPMIYVVEDLRGWMALHGVQSYWEKKGETFDFAKYLPPPVPDEKNLAMVPLFEVKELAAPPGVFWTVSFDVPAVSVATHSDAKDFDTLSFGKWNVGDLGRPKDWRKTLLDDYKGLGLKMPAPEGDLALFDAIFPFAEQLRADAKTRPVLRFPIDYSANPPMAYREDSLCEFGARICEVFAAHGNLALENGRADLALDDFNISLIFVLSSDKEPGDIGGPVAMSEFQLAGQLIFRGLARHAWSEAQLAAIDEKLRQINYLSNYQYAVRNETSAIVGSMSFIRKVLLRRDPANNQDARALYGPSGWLDFNVAQLIDSEMEYVRTVDPAKGTIDLAAVKRREAEHATKAASWTGTMPWNQYYTGFPDPADESMQLYSRAQVWLDEMRIAIALERYRLAHGTLPEKLDVLAPEYLDPVPHDIFGGMPYHYSPKQDGTYLLYSIGWNGVDDGGVVAVDSNGALDNDNGDWVWPMPKR